MIRVALVTFLVVVGDHKKDDSKQYREDNDELYTDARLRVTISFDVHVFWYSFLFLYGTQSAVDQAFIIHELLHCSERLQLIASIRRYGTNEFVLVLTGASSYLTTVTGVDRSFPLVVLGTITLVPRTKSLLILENGGCDRCLTFSVRCGQLGLEVDGYRTLITPSEMMT